MRKREHIQKTLLRASENLVKKSPVACGRFNGDYYTDIFNNKKKELQLFNVFEDDVRKILSCLNVNKDAGIDQIPAKFLKESAHVLAYPLSKIINLSVKLRTSRRM